MKSRIGRGSESEGLSFNLGVALSCIIVSLILEDEDWIRDQGLEVRDDFIDADRSQTRTTMRFQVIEQDEDLSD